jgi:LacI family transcriptional regulator
MRRFPTLRDIARAAGVHHTTVSRALRNDASIPRATRERVSRIAAEQGYAANPYVSAWMAARRGGRRVCDSPVIAYLICTPTMELWKTTPSIYRYFLGARDRARELGFDLEPFWLAEPGMTRKRIAQILDARGIRGIIVGSSGTSHAHLNLDWTRFAAVAQGFTLKAPALSRTANHYAASMRAALRAMRRLGYARIAWATTPPVDARTRGAWTSEFLYYQQFIAPEARVPLLFWSPGDERGFLRWWSKHRPEAILTHEMALRSILEAGGVRVPEDAGFASIDWHPGLEGWAGVDHEIENAGAVAVDLLSGLLSRNETGLPTHPRTVLTEGRWVAGASLRKLGPAAPLRHMHRQTELHLSAYATAGAGRRARNGASA